MPYSTLADVHQAAGGPARLLQLADWGNNAAVDPDVVARAIVSADVLIDSFASKLYHVPFNPVPSIIKDFSAELAMLTIARGPHGLTDQRQRRWNEIAGTERGSEGWLYRLSRGEVTPGGDPLPPKHGTMVVDSVDTALPSDREVSRRALDGYC